MAYNIDFLRNVSAAGPGAVYKTDGRDLAVVQVDGSFTSVRIALEGRAVADEGTWERIGVFKVSEPNDTLPAISSLGIYECPIFGLAEIRFNVLSIADGSVSVEGVFYDTANGETYPLGSDGPNVAQMGGSNLFVKGVAEQIFMDPTTGNIVGYDRTATNASVATQVNLQEIVGGMGNRLVGVLPDSVRINGTYESAAFSLETREKIMGGQIAYDARASVCEELTGDEDGVLTVTGEPAPFYGDEDNETGNYWCYVRERGASEWIGTNYTVNAETKKVNGFYAEEDKVYEVMYYTHNASVSMLPIPTMWNPVVMTVQVRYAVYAKQTKSDTGNQGVLKGWLYFIVPRAMLTADAGVNGSQTGTATTDGSWMALTNKAENLPMCADCDGSSNPMAYYVFVPCGDTNESVEAIISVGGGMVLDTGKKKQLPIKLLMPDDTLAQPDFTTLNYTSDDETVATVTNLGEVVGVAPGTTYINAYLAKKDGTVLSTQTMVVIN